MSRSFTSATTIEDALAAIEAAASNAFVEVREAMDAE